MAKTKRWAKVQITFEVLAGWLNGNFPLEKVKSNLPKGAKIVRVYDEQMNNPASFGQSFVVVLESKSFDVLHNGMLIPSFDLVIEDCHA